MAPSQGLFLLDSLGYILLMYDLGQGDTAVMITDEITYRKEGDEAVFGL